MTKRFISLLSVMLLFVFLLCSCGHEHNWEEATCTTPKTCAECGKTEGEALGHDWALATCTDPQTCTRCGETQGSALGHIWTDATCTAPKTCSVCGMTEGEALGHQWNDATCTAPKTCSNCGLTEGEALGHQWLEATCTDPKTCSVCGATEGKALGHDAPGLSCTQDATCNRCGELIPALGHSWEDATCTSPKTCTTCGETEGSALGHTPGNPQKKNVTTPTCTQGGQYDEVVYCTQCHEELSRTTIYEDPLGHTCTTGICSRCGLEVYETISGYGDDVISNIDVGNGLYRVHIVYTGTRNFIVKCNDSLGNRDLLVNEIGSYEGYVFLKDTPPYTFEISASGDWSFTIEKITTTNTSSFSGTGDFVTDMFSASSGTWELTHDGDSNFIVWVYTTSGADLLVNTIGDYNGKKYITIPSGSMAMFEILADGNWTIKKVQ